MPSSVKERTHSEITMIMKYLKISTVTSLFRNHDPVKSFSSIVIHYISNSAANVSETKYLIKTVETNKGRYKPGGNIYIVDFGVNCPFKELSTFSLTFTISLQTMAAIYKSIPENSCGINWKL